MLKAQVPTKPFRSIPLSMISENMQLMMIESELEDVRLKHAYRMAKKALELLRTGRLIGIGLDIASFLRSEGVFHDMIPSVTQMVIETYLEDE